MFGSDQYLQMADEALRLAEAATSDEHRVIWLKIAEGYRVLADRAPDPPAQAGENSNRDAR